MSCRFSCQICGTEHTIEVPDHRVTLVCSCLSHIDIEPLVVHSPGSGNLDGTWTVLCDGVPVEMHVLTVPGPGVRWQVLPTGEPLIDRWIKALGYDAEHYVERVNVALNETHRPGGLYPLGS